MIEVIYDGEFPNACSGMLTIIVDGELVYQNMLCCESTGSVSFDENWSELVLIGELIWKDADQFSKKIQRAVKKALSQIEVCCGGCV